ncbi:MAG: hypothetical protein P1V36_05550 [Planctomycetota bacterium]|nr:hypothetical protein [Planctomycetota bacterium]
MRSSKIFVAMLAVTALAFLVGCGGGGNGFRVPDNPLIIDSSSLPDVMSGEYVDFDIPITGGCNGPYVVEVIAGTLPRGVGTLEGTVTKLQGWVLEDGIYNFTIKITDTSPECTPFYTVTQSYTWDIQQGPVKIVDADPRVVLNADYDDPQKYGDIDALETVVFSSFVAYNLIPAGGQGPYTCAVIDDPNDPDDGNLPLGVGMAPQSCSIVGTPSQVLPGGVPFRLTFEVTDAVGQKATRKLQWKIDTPPIIVSNTSLVDGKAGTSYSDAIQIVDGVPPFAYELTDNAPDDDGDPDTTDNVNDNIDYPPGFTPVILGYVNPALPFQLAPVGPAIDNARLVAGGAGRIDYPATTADGPNYGPMPSEGLYFRESGAGAGSFFGTPRRRGTFTMYVHAYSTLVPNERGQHGFKALSHTIDPSEPPVGVNPAFEMTPNFTLEGAFSAPGAIPPLVPATTCGTLAEAEVTVIYNPDAGTGHPAPGLKLLGQGGVPQDGYVDSPHEAQRFLDLTEADGEYNWTYDPITPLPEMDLYPALGNGVFGTGNAALLERSAARPVRFTVQDEQLPESVRDASTTLTRDFDISVGPDLVIITESTQSFTGTSTTNSPDTNLHDRLMKIRKFQVLGGSGSVSDLANADMTTGHTVPGIAGVADLGELISGVSPGDTTIDLLRMSVNPGGWWDDQGNMNPKAARVHAGVDKNSGRPYYQPNGWYNSGGGWQASVSAADLPDTPTIVHSPATGVFADGGKMYAFNSANRFGLFIIRSSSEVYVPFAIQKGTGGFWKFGDGMVSADADDSNLNMVPMSVSPDGRYAVVKILRTSTTSFNTMIQRTNGALVLISLTGEKFSSGETYQIIDPAAEGTYMFSTSVVMTDQSIYFLTGNYSSTYSSWRDHYIQSYQYRNTSGGLLPSGGLTAVSAALASGVGANWTQTSGTPMQTAFHQYDNPAQSFSTFLSTGTFGIVQRIDQDAYLYDGWNMLENATAPVPFRVSADGQHCALLAGARAGSTSGTDVMLHHAWVASNSGDFRQASTVARHSPNGASRGYGLRRGPSSYQHWGKFSGPTTAFEIADDGSAIAYTYNRVGSVSSTSSTTNWNNEREDLIVVEGTGMDPADPFTSATETEVTKDIFGGSIKWRFGSIVFTKDNQGVIFWGGASSLNATSTDGSSNSSYGAPASATHFLGTYYAFNLNVANQVRGVMPTTAGGIGSFPTYSSSAKFQPATPSYTTNLGTIKPFGGFISKSRDYFYVVNYHPNSASDQTQLTLLGVNVEDLTAGSTASGHQKGRGFKTGNFPNRRGFLPGYYYAPHYALENAYYNPHHTHGGGMQTMHKDTGNVYFMSHYMSSGPTRSTSQFSSGPTIATYWGDYGYRGFHMEGFNADVGGPVSRLSHGGLGGDTSSRSGQYFVVSNDGSKIAYGYQTTSSTRYANQDKIGVITHVGFDPNTGAPNPDMDNTDSNKAFIAEASNGRGGEAMTFDSGGSKLYYAFKAGASNENLKELVELKINPGTGPETPLRFGPGRRYNVLYSGR